MIQELKEYLKEPLMWFGVPAAFLDGVALAQAIDWMTSTGRMSIWVLM